MHRPAADILTDALELPAEDRAAIAGALIESLDDEVDDEADAAWSTEIERRVAEIDAGAVTLVPWDTVRRRLTDARGR